MLQFVHVLGDVLAKDVTTMNICLELLALIVIPRESLRPNNSTMNTHADTDTLPYI